MRYLGTALLSCSSHPVAPGLSIRANGRKRFRGFVLSLLLGKDFERLVNNLAELDKGTLQHINRTGISFFSARPFRQSTAGSLQSDMQRGTGVPISDQIVRNRLGSIGLRSWHPFAGLILTPRHLSARRAFAREHQNWQLRQWRPVLFTDDSRCNLSGSDGTVRVWRSTG